MARTDALVTPAVMRWARESAGYTPEQAAEKIGRPVEEIHAWEEGSARPSLAQAREAARVYRRSLAVFYLPEPPTDFGTLRDFRVLPADEPREYSPELSFLIRQMRVRQEWMREYLASEGAADLTFVGSADLGNEPRSLAETIRQVIGVRVEDQMACRSRNEALNLWITRTETAGVYICRRSTVDCLEARGFALPDDLAPFIFVNSSDAEAARLFTLVHELAHLWINVPGISNLNSEGTSPDAESTRVEEFCNRVASFALLDSAAFERIWSALPRRDAVGDRVLAASRAFKVSEEVVARRLLDTSRFSRREYEALRREYAARWRRVSEERERAASERKGGPSYYLLKVLDNGRSFTRAVIGAYRGGFITGRDLGNLLEVKVNHVPRLAEVALAMPQ